MPIRLSELLSPERIELGVSARSKKDLIDTLGALVHRAMPSIGSQEVREALSEREKLATTGIGEGIAVPHARLAGVDAPTAFLATIPGGLDFDAVDGRPVEIAVALLSPPTASDPLKALAKVARFLRDPALRRRLLAATDTREAWGAIRSHEAAR